MSGRKYSQVELAAQVHEVIRCKMEVTETLANAESLAAALTDAAGSTEALKNAAESVSGTLQAIRAEMDSMSKAYDKSKLMRLDINEVRSRRARIERLGRDVESMAEACKSGCGAAGLRTGITHLREQAARQRDDLRPWIEAEFDEFVGTVERVLADTDAEIRATGAASSVAPRILSLGPAFSGLVGRSAERRSLDADRRYVADALRKVCADDLGFAARFLPQAKPADELVVEVDTFAYGLIHFRLELDGTIRSRSEVMGACPANFGKIEAQLRSLGVLSCFRYEADQRPVVIERDEKPIPDGDARVSAGGER